MKIVIYEVICYDRYYPMANNIKFKSTSLEEANKYLDSIKNKYDYAGIGQTVINIEEDGSIDICTYDV